MTAHIDEIKVYITLHSYGQYILTPFAYTLEPADNVEQLNQVGNAGADAIRQRYGTNYVVGSSSEVLCKLYKAYSKMDYIFDYHFADMNSGSSRDWIKGIHKINISYTIELRDQGKFKLRICYSINNAKTILILGNYGFILPPEQIIPNCEEIFDGLKAIVGECRTIGYL